LSSNNETAGKKGFFCRYRSIKNDKNEILRHSLLSFLQNDRIKDKDEIPEESKERLPRQSLALLYLP